MDEVFFLVLLFSKRKSTLDDKTPAFRSCLVIYPVSLMSEVKHIIS